MSATLPDQIPDDWYATAFDAASAEMAWTDRTGPEVDRVAKILQPRGDERVLDLACGSGRHSLELRRRGFSVVGADISPDLIEIARRAKERLPQRSWIPASDMIELVEHRWEKKTRCMEREMGAARFGEVLEDLGGVEFSQRLYSVDELRQIYVSVGMELLNVYHGSGRPRKPKPGQFEVFVEVRKLI